MWLRNQMSWAAAYIEKLLRGETVSFRARGTSMEGKISNGQTVTIVPITDEIAVDDIVLCKVRGKQFLHLVKAIRGDGQYQIGNNRGFINGWINKKSIFGKCIAIAS